jgi:hypothetical protein
MPALRERAGKTSESERYGTARRVLAVVLGASLLMLACLYNGYPLLFYDSEMYVHYVRSSIRPPFYALLLYPMHLGSSLWLVAFWQSLLVSHLLYFVTDRVFGSINIFRYTVIITVLALLSPLPWMTGFVTPDIFTPLLILSLYFLVFRPTALSGRQRIYLTVISGAAMLVHSSALPLVTVLFVYAAALKLFFRSSQVCRGYLPQRILTPALIAALLLVTNNAWMHGSFSLSPSGYAHLLARLITDGPAVAYLQSHCAEKRYRICDSIDSLPRDSDQFLWSEQSPFRKLGWFDGYRREGAQIVTETIRAYPLWTLQTMMQNAIRQLSLIDLSVIFDPLDQFPLVADAQRTHFAREYPAFVGSRQTLGTLGLQTICQVHGLALIAAVVLVALATVRFWRNGDFERVSFFGWTIFSAIVSAVMPAALSIPNARYLTRVSWLITYLAVSEAVTRRSRQRQQ